jgi:hypothetical protein
LGNSKIIMDDGFGEFWRVYMGSSNLIYVVVIFYLGHADQCMKEKTKLVLKRGCI